MLALLLLAALQATPKPAAPDPLAPLTVYNGSWTIRALHTMAGEGKSDQLVNHCTRTVAYYTCEQVVNGKPMALLVFVPGDGPGKFHSQPILPNGYSTGRGDLTIDGDHWTFLGSDTKPSKTTLFRTENYFRGPNNIHFEQYESTDDAKTWTKTNEGDETRN